MILFFYNDCPKYHIIEEFKYYLKKWDYKRTLNNVRNGPDAVANNLLRELSIRIDLHWRLGFPQIKNFSNIHTIWVVSGVRDLIWAIEYKERIGATTLLAGPNLVVVPWESGGIIGNNKIDKIIVPSQWVKKLYETEMPHIQGKVTIWPVGIDTDYWNNEKKKEKSLQKILIYNKKQDELCSEIIRNIPLGWEYEVLSYGNYTREDYKRSLCNSRFMIWLSQSESQGVALLEAISMDIPIMAWDPKRWYYNSTELKKDYAYDASSCPYFSSECGVTFSNLDEFQSSLYQFIEEINLNKYNPRKFLFNSQLQIGETLSEYKLI